METNATDFGFVLRYLVKEIGHEVMPFLCVEIRLSGG